MNITRIQTSIHTVPWGWHVLDDPLPFAVSFVERPLDVDVASELRSERLLCIDDGDSSRFVVRVTRAVAAMWGACWACSECWCLDETSMAWIAFACGTCVCVCVLDGCLWDEYIGYTVNNLWTYENFLHGASVGLQTIHLLFVCGALMRACMCEMPDRWVIEICLLDAMLCLWTTHVCVASAYGKYMYARVYWMYGVLKNVCIHVPVYVYVY